MGEKSRLATPGRVLRHVWRRPRPPSFPWLTLRSPNATSRRGQEPRTGLLSGVGVARRDFSTGSGAPDGTSRPSGVPALLLHSAHRGRVVDAVGVEGVLDDLRLDLTAL